ncbi:MAG: thioredoxin [Herbinix sp.]|jgi:thioredoxin 1|nr:thioredoxin [Herbinix sp.]
MSAKHLTTVEFEQEVINSDIPVLVDFWAPWCGPCKMLLPTIEELADELTDVKIYKVNVDEEGALAERFRIMTIPSLLVFKNGQVVTKSIGAKPKAEILQMLEA